MFNEANPVEGYICDLLCGPPAGGGRLPAAREAREAYGRDSLALDAAGLGWGGPEMNDSVGKH